MKKEYSKGNMRVGSNGMDLFVGRQRIFVADAERKNSRPEKELLANARRASQCWNSFDDVVKGFEKFAGHKDDCNLLALFRLTKKNSKKVGCICGFSKMQARIETIKVLHLFKDLGATNRN